MAGALVGGCASSGGGSTPTSPSIPVGENSSSARPPQSPGPSPPPATGNCAADQARSAVGRPGTSDLLEQARVAAGAGLARFIRPNQAITLEYSGARLNLYLDGRDVVSAAVCG